MTYHSTVNEYKMDTSISLDEVGKVVPLEDPTPNSSIVESRVKLTSDGAEQRQPNVKPPNVPPPPPLPSDRVYFKLIRNWEGVVAHLDGDSFTAHVRDVRNPGDQGEEEFEIDIAQVPDDDKFLVRPGGIFFLTIGYWVTKGGQRSTDTRIVFRRMPRWSANDIARAHRKADEFLDFFGVQQRSEKTA